MSGHFSQHNERPPVPPVSSVLRAPFVPRVSWVSLAGVAAALGALVWQSHRVEPVARDAVMWFLVACAAYGVALWGLHHAGRNAGERVGGAGVAPGRALLWVLGVAAVLHALASLGQPLFSDDIYRFAWDGRVLRAGVNPWRFAPDAPELVALRDGHWSHINHPQMRTLYPPVAQVFFGLLSQRGAVWALQLAAAAATLVVAVLVYGLMGGFAAAAKEGTQRRALVACAAYAWHPLACVETAMSGHLLEPLALCALLGTVALLQRPVLTRRHAVGAALCLALGVGVKLIPLVLLVPLAWGLPRHRALFGALAVVGSALLLWPMLHAGTDGVETLDAFARRWEGNAGLFRLFKYGALYGVGACFGTFDGEAMVHLRWLDGIARELQPTFFALHKDGAFDPAAPGAFPLLDVALAIARGLSLLVVGGAALLAMWRRISPMQTAALIIAAALLVAPVLHPWYILWFLPFAAMLGMPWVLAFGAVSALSYLSLDMWWAEGLWREWAWVLAVEYGVLALALWAAGRRWRVASRARSR